MNPEFGLLFSYREHPEDQTNAIQRGLDLLKNLNLKEEMQENRRKFLANKIDVTAFMVWFVENFPESRQKMLLKSRTGCSCLARLLTVDASSA